MSPILVLLVVLLSCSVALCFQTGSGGLARSYKGMVSISSGSRLSMVGTGDVELGGKVVVTGVGALDEDEFLLNLLNEQQIWESIVLGTPDIVASRKRFLSRSARYSGLDNLLEHAPIDLSSKVDFSDDLCSVLEGANTWIAVNCKQDDIPKMAEAALKQGVKKALFTLELPAARINETVIPEFEQAVLDFKKVGHSFTGIRHGEIIDGTEDNPYEIFNSTTPCLENTVERGVLARVATELLLIGASENANCGLSSGSAFSQAYLNVLRSSGLTRTQEVTKIYEGGVQKMARMTVEKYEKDKLEAEKKKEEKALRKLKEKEEEEAAQAELALEASQGQGQASGNNNNNDLAEVQMNNPMQSKIRKRDMRDGSESITPGWDEDQANEGELTAEQKLEERTNQILAQVYAEYEARLYAKSTSRTDFFDQNKAMATDLAKEEVAAAAAKLAVSDEEKEAQQVMLSRLMDVNRKQYSKLLQLERIEMAHQKSISDVWVKYIYLLLEKTMKTCEQRDLLFFNQDQFAQTLLLREMANELRAECSLNPYDVIYDPLDAAIIVAHPQARNSVPSVDLSLSVDIISAALTDKYSETMKTVPALRGASQIVDLALDLLSKETPAAPLTVFEKRSGESKVKQEAVSAGRLDKISKRGKPASEIAEIGGGDGEGGDGVGRL